MASSGLLSEDHPRSRGVYHAAARLIGGGGGSSPLARGLRRSGERLKIGRRIIPARAGFTIRPCRARCSRRDHPRSRGVYFRLRAGQGRNRGSSPLARGLQDSGQHWDVQVTDHPRSRGVYPGAGPRHRRPAGSSPLARGLHDLGLGLGAHDRIIPARAGFTR